jgi:hypothetical protein
METFDDLIGIDLHMLSALGAQRDVKLWGRRAGAYMACE